MQNSICQKGGYDLGRDVRAPEETKTDRELSRLVEEAQVEHNVGDEASLDEAQQTASRIESLIVRQTTLAD